MGRRLLLALSIAAFATSLALPAVATVDVKTGETEIVPGFMLLAVGWVGLCVGSLAWIANPFYALGVVGLLRRRPVPEHWAPARWLLFIAWLFGLTTVFQMVVPFLGGTGGNLKILQPLAGFYCWAASLTAALISAWLQPTGTPRRTDPAEWGRAVQRSKLGKVLNHKRYVEREGKP